MLKVIVTSVALVSATALAGCATTGVGSTVTLSSASPAVNTTIQPRNTPAPAYRVYPNDDENGTPDYGTDLNDK